MSDLVEALKVTTEEVMIVAEITVGQCDNPLWMDARQWQITASYFGRIANRQMTTILHHFLSCYLVTMDMDLTCNQVGD